MLRVAVMLALALAVWLAARGGIAFVRGHRRTAVRVRSQARRWAPFIAVAGVLFADLAIDALGTFGLADSADETLQRAFGSVWGPVYGGLERVGQDQIVLVALDEAYLADAGGSWPPPYATTADMLSRVAAARPRLIFYDGYFDHAHRDGTGQVDSAGVRMLADMIGVVRQTGVEVLTGPVNAEDRDLAPLAAAVTQQVGLTTEDPRPFAYDLADRWGRPMAAAAIYRRLRPGVALHPKTLSLDWGFGASAWLARHWADRRSPCLAPTLLSRITGVVRLAGRALAPALTHDPVLSAGVAVACPYFDIVPLSWLSSAEVRARLKGRVVIVGSTLPWVADTSPTPLLGDVPGLMVHAMALDNLLEAGDGATRYPRNDPFNQGIGLDSGDFVQAALLAAGFLVVFVAHKRLHLEADAALPLRIKLEIWLAVAAFGMLIAGLYNWPLFKMLNAAVVGPICLEAWERFQKHSPHY